METNHITAGQRYTDNRGNVRLVLGFVEPRRVTPQRDGRRVQYRLVCKRRSSHALGSTHETPVEAFAQWARRLVD